MILRASALALSAKALPLSANALALGEGDACSRSEAAGARVYGVRVCGVCCAARPWGPRGVHGTDRPSWLLADSHTLHKGEGGGGVSAVHTRFPARGDR
eukprot:4101282-Pleurochrysis_carterae.AAC.1